MAKSKPDNKKTSKEITNTKVTRIKAVDSSPVSKKSAAPAAVNSDTPEAVKKPSQKDSNPLKAIGGYFKGSWQELKQVRWPTRKATWELTGAVLLFTAFFVVLIVALDAVFEYLFELMIG